MKNKMKWMLAIGLLSCSMAMAQQQSDILSVSASANADNAALAFDKNVKTMWTLPSQALKTEQWLMFTIQQPGDVCELDLQMQGVNKNELKEVLDIFVTYDPMNLGTPVNYRIEGNDKQMKVKFTPKYGAHVKLNFKPGKLDGGIVPLLRQGEHEGEKALRFQRERLVPQVMVGHHRVVAGFLNAEYRHVGYLLPLVLKSARFGGFAPLYHRLTSHEGKDMGGLVCAAHRRKIWGFPTLKRTLDLGIEKGRLSSKQPPDRPQFHKQNTAHN